MSRLRREVREARSESRQLRERVDELDGQVALLRAKKGSLRSTNAKETNSLHATASQPVTKKLPKLPVVKLNAEEQQKTDEPIMIKLGPANTLPVDRSVLSKKDPVLTKKRVLRKATKAKAESANAKESEAASYKEALAQLRENNNLKESRRLFNSFRKRYPNSKYQVNAMYWLAEISSQNGEESRAVDEFLAVAEMHPRSSKAAHALLRVGQLMQKRGDTAKAKEVLSRVTQKYPNTDAAQVAKSTLASINEKAKQ
ncbi:MAG: tol-pal system protein YbgF [Myxococcota bacterium]|nr:tol-pal system protein YbgF [Myxococcota bacterium]